SSGGKPSTRMRPGAPGSSRRGLPWAIGIGAALVLVGLTAFLAIDMKRADHRVADAIAAAAGGPDLTLPPSTPAPTKPEPTPKSKPAPEPAAHPVPEPAKVEPATAEPGPQPSPSPSPEPEKPSDPTPTPDPAAAPAPEKKTQPAPAAPKSKPGTPALPEDTRLAELEKGFRAAFERDANQAFLGALEQLDQGYLRAVERARTAARKNGNLDEVTALDSEKTRMTAGPGVPPADNPGIPASLISLRKTYREAVGKLEATRDEKTAPLYEKYLVALDAYESELTRANRIENALAVREFRKTIVARRSRLKLPAEMAKAGDAPASMPADADAASEVKIVTSSGYRELATWILSEGGWIRIVQDGREIDIRPENAEALPNGRFSVTEAHLTPPEMKDLTDDDFSRFTAAPDLRILELARCPLRHFPALRVMKKLVSARFGQCPNLTDELFADLGKLPVLEDFYFSNEGVPQTSLTGLALDHLAKGKALKAVGLENPPFSDAELAKLAKIPTLETLNLSRSSEVNGSFLDAFAGHPALASLGLSYLDSARFDVARLASLSDVPTLSRLQMDVFTVSAEGFRAIGKLTSLKWLYCQPAPGVGDEDLAALAGLSVLEDLKIDRPQFTGTGVRSLTCGQTLRYLSFFDGPALSNEGLAAVGETFPNLQWLTFSGPDIDSSGLAALTKLSSLQTIEIRSDSLDDEALAAFAAMKKLGRLDLYSANNQFTAAGLKELAKSKSIEYLDISVPKLDGEGWKTLATFPALNTLFLHDSPITPEGVGELARLKSLQHLMLTAEEGDLSDEIVEPLRGLKRLRTLDLAGAIFRKNPDLVKRIREALPAVEVRG
ncbi:MAG: hypothetical protein KDM91_18010, partial [Verrucomicrobiae bacterium]|nr:hypothetical protein [Verrucomicrobiae bacterium]